MYNDPQFLEGRKPKQQSIILYLIKRADIPPGSSALLYPQIEFTFTIIKKILDEKNIGIELLIDDYVIIIPEKFRSCI